MQSKLTRRQLIKLAALGGAGSALVACAQATPQVIQQTVIVEKQQTVQVEVTKEVEKQVEVTKEVEVTAVPVQGPQTLTIWDAWVTTAETYERDKNGGEQYPFILAGELFKKDHPGVELAWEDHGWDAPLRQNVIAALMAGTQPDVITGEIQFPEYASLGAVLPLDDALTPEQKQDIVPGTYKSSLYEGKIHALAVATAIWKFMGRKDLMDDAGVTTMPKTMDEWSTMMSEISKAHKPTYYGYALEGPLGTVFGCHLRLDSYFYANNAMLTKEPDDPYFPWFNNPAAYPIWEAFRNYQPNNEPGLFLKPDESADGYWAAKKAVFKTGGVWDVPSSFGNKTTNPPTEPWDIVISDNFPGPTPVSIVVANIQNGAMTTAKNKELAVDWVINRNRPEVQDLIWTWRRILPTLKSSLTKMIEAPEDRNYTDNTNRKFMPKETQQFAQTLRDATISTTPIYVKQAGKLLPMLGDLTVDCIMKTDTPVQAICEDYQKKAEEILAAAT